MASFDELSKMVLRRFKPDELTGLKLVAQMAWLADRGHTEWLTRVFFRVDSMESFIASLDAAEEEIRAKA